MKTTEKHTPKSLSQELAKIRRRLRNSAILVFVLFLLLIGSSTFYFQYGYNEIQDLKDPNNLIALGVETALRPNALPDTLSDAQRFVEQQVKEHAPELASMASQAALEMAPEARVMLEDFVTTEIALLIEQGGQYSEEQFGLLVDEHRDTIQRAMNDLADSEQLPKETMDELVKIIENDIDANLRLEAQVIMGTLYRLNDKLDRLAIGKGLTETEQNEREAIMLAKRVILEKADPDLAGKELPNQHEYDVDDNTEDAPAKGASEES